MGYFRQWARDRKLWHVILGNLNSANDFLEIITQKKIFWTLTVVSNCLQSFFSGTFLFPFEMLYISVFALLWWLESFSHSVFDKSWCSFCLCPHWYCCRQVCFFIKMSKIKAICQKSSLQTVEKWLRCNRLVIFNQFIGCPTNIMGKATNVQWSSWPIYIGNIINRLVTEIIPDITELVLLCSRYGRKKVILGCLLMKIAMGLMSAFAPNYAVLATARLLLGPPWHGFYVLPLMIC